MVGGSNTMMVVHRRVRHARGPLGGFDAVFSYETHSDGDYRRRATLDWAETYAASDPILHRIVDTVGTTRAFGHRKTLESKNRAQSDSTLRLLDRLELGDRANAIIPLGSEVEVSFCIDRLPGDAPFSAADEALMKACLQGLRPLAARFALSRGLMAGQRQLSVYEAQLVEDLLGFATSDEIAEKHAISVARLHSIEDHIYRKLVVPNRLGLLNLWRKGQSPTMTTSARELPADKSRFGPVPTPQSSFVDRVRQALDEAMDTENYELEAVAKRLGASVRSLQRELTEADTTFRELADQARRRRAAKLLGSTDLLLTQIALRLGYEQASSLNRAVRRWTGLTPSAWRRQLRDDQ